MNETRERLTQLIHDAHMAVISRDDNSDTYTAIAGYLLDNGVIVPSVCAGQTVWCVMNNYTLPVEGKIGEYNIRSDGIAYFRIFRQGGSVIGATEDAIGKTVFLTREAAEDVLKARRTNADE